MTRTVLEQESEICLSLSACNAVQWVTIMII